MKKLFALSFTSFILCTHGFTHGLQLGGAVNMPVMGRTLEQSIDEKEFKYILSSDSSKAHSPIDGSVYYVGDLKDYGLSIIIKNAHYATIISNLDRSYVVKNQYLLQNDAIGSVAYHSKIIFIVKKIQKTNGNYIVNNDQQQQTNPIDIVQKFQNKLLNIVKTDAGYLHRTIRNSTPFNGGQDKALNYNEITNLLKDTGFPEKSIPTMYCIAKWESGLNPRAINFNTNNTVDVGLFQINSSWFKKCNTNIATLYDEKENSRCALIVLKKQGFPAWTTYNKYKNTDYCNM